MERARRATYSVNQNDKSTEEKDTNKSKMRPNCVCILILLFLSVCVSVGMIWGGTRAREHYEQSYDEYEQCLLSINCTQECSVRGCRTVGCDIFYCPREPYNSVSSVIYALGSISLFAFTITILYLLDDK